MGETDAALLARLAPAAPTPYHRLNPRTKAVLAIAATAGALVLGGFAWPALLLAGLVLPGAVLAGQLGRVLRLAALVTLPVAVSVAAVSVLTRPGATVLFTLGPFDATLEGATFAAGVILRLFVMAAALTLFGLTTPARALVADLQRRGASPRLTFAAAATLEAVPAMVRRARAIQAAQRARGLDTEGSIGARLRGLVPMLAPAVLGSLADVESRSVALEARGFTRPGPRQPLWAPRDARTERLARWGVSIGLTAVVIGTLAGALPRLP